MALTTAISGADTTAPQTIEAAASAGRFSYVNWGPVIAGALGAIAISFVLLTFGSAIGLSAMSPWPNTGPPSIFLMIVTAIWVALVQVGSLAAGGYIAGRMRSQWADSTVPEREFRDGVHGFLVWSLAVVVGVWLVASTAAEGVKTGIQAAATIGAGGARSGPTLAQGPADYAIDYILRPGPNPAAQPAFGPAADGGQLRTELGRIFVTSLRNGILAPRERTYLGQLVARRSGLSPADAETRVDEAFAEAKIAETRVRETADKARKATAVAAFLAAATLLVSCAAAAAGAAMGGHHRDHKASFRFLGRDRFW